MIFHRTKILSVHFISGRSRGGPPCLAFKQNETEARRAEKKNFETGPPPTYLRVWVGHCLCLLLLLKISLTGGCQIRFHFL